MNDAVDADGMHADVRVTEVFDDDDDGKPQPLNRSSPSADTKHFFEKCAPIKGDKRAKTRCISCS